MAQDIRRARARASARSALGRPRGLGVCHRSPSFDGSGRKEGDEGVRKTFSDIWMFNLYTD